MKHSLFIVIVCLLASCHAPRPLAETAREGWELVWQDEFDYSGLPDPAKWVYETGHVRNREQQYYTTARPENIRVEGGLLTITGRKEVFPNQNYQRGSDDWRYRDSLAQYTSASIHTLGKASWLYGRVEIRAKMPAGSGMWPALWMLGINRPLVGWPAAGEIDIMEFIGNRPSEVHGTVHYADPAGGGHRSSGGKITAEGLSENFHIYAVEWNSDSIHFFFDETRYFSFATEAAGTNDNPFRKPFFLKINLAMGADWPGPIDDAVLPQQFRVDYVRVYKRK